MTRRVVHTMKMKSKLQAIIGIKRPIWPTRIAALTNKYNQETSEKMTGTKSEEVTRESDLIGKQPRRTIIKTYTIEKHERSERISIKI